MLTSFDDLRQRAAGVRRRCAVPGAADQHTLEAVLAAQREGWVEPVLIAERDAVTALPAAREITGNGAQIVDCPAGRNPAQIAVSLIRDGQADFIMKGALQTRDLLRPILDKAGGLNDDGFITHLGLMQLARYHKLLAMSDSAVIPHPTLEAKAKIVGVCTSALRALGIERPTVAALCAVETVSKEMPETLDAARLQELSEAGEFGDVRVIGPISYDLATSRESARIKGYDAPGAGDVDMLLVPEMVTGNIMSKIWNAESGNILAGCLIGTRVPVALTSRSAGMDEKLHSLLLCVMLTQPGGTGQGDALLLET